MERRPAEFHLARRRARQTVARCAAGAGGLRAALVLALLLLCAPAWPRPAPAQPFPPVERPPEQEWVLQVRLQRLVLSDVMLAYVTDTDVYVPLSQLALALEFPIDADPEAGRAVGWFLDEERRFRLDLAQGVVESDGRRFEIPPGAVEPHADDLYVRTAQLAQWLPISLELNRSEAVLYVYPREPLPVQTREERQSRRTGLGGFRTEADYPRLEVPYQAASWPFFDLDVSHNVSRADKDAETIDITRYSVRFSGDLLYAESRLAIVGDDVEGPRNVRFSLARRDPEARLLGPLRLTEVVGGDVFAPALPLMADQREGRGALVSSFPLGRPLEADRTTLRGELPPGWEVELYRNDVLLAFQQPDAEGRYTFAEVPLVFGPNELRLVFYGPQGQVREETRTVLITTELLRPGELRYRVSSTEDERDTIPVSDPPPGGYPESRRTSLSLEGGVSRRLSLALNAAEYFFRDLPRKYVGVGARLGLGTVLVRLDAVQDITPEDVLEDDFIESQLPSLLGREPRRTAQQLSIQTRFWGISWLLERAQFQEFGSEREVPRLDPLLHRTRLRLDFTVPEWLLPAINVSLDTEVERRLSGEFLGIVSNRLSTRFWNVSLSNSLDYFATGTDGVVRDELASGQALISARFGSLTIRGTSDYDVELHREEKRLRATRRGLALVQRFDSGYTASVGMVDDLTVPRRRVYDVGLAKRFEALAVGFTASHGSDGSYGANLTLSTSFGYDPRQGYVAHGNDIASGGAVSALAFEDDDGDGRMGPDEQPLAGVGFLGHGDARTDSAGRLFLTGLPAYYPTAMAPDMSTLEDPFMVPSVPGVEVMPRPGATALVDFPIVRSGDIEGMIYLRRPGAVTGAANVRLELVDEAGLVVREVRSEYDGYFLVSQVVPGSYRLRVSPEQAEQLRLETPPSIELTITADTGVITGLELVVTRRPLEGQ